MKHSEIEILKGGTNDATIGEVQRTTSSQTTAKPVVSGSAFAVYTDSIRYGLSDKNELMAVFRLEEQARIFGASMWGQFYIIKPIVSEHFR
jgi:hypothetical protein